MHRSQIFFYILLSFICGVFAGSFFSISQNAVLIAAIICALLIAVFYRRGSRCRSGCRSCPRRSARRAAGAHRYQTSSDSSRACGRMWRSSRNIRHAVRTARRRIANRSYTSRPRAQIHRPSRRHRQESPRTTHRRRSVR